MTDEIPFRVDFSFLLTFGIGKCQLLKNQQRKANSRVSVIFLGSEKPLLPGFWMVSMSVYGCLWYREG